LIKHTDKFHSIAPDASLNDSSSNALKTNTTISTHPASPSPTVSHNRILIVDDDPDIATLFKITLERVGLAVDVFNDPLLALSSYKAGIYDLLLLDIRMPIESQKLTRIVKTKLANS
jgi:PleD family two-component response regulator